MTTPTAGPAWGSEPLETLGLSRLFGLAMRAVGKRYWGLGNEAGLGGSAMGLMVMLSRSAEGVSVRDAAKSLWITPASLSGVADRLERGGLLERRRGVADRRVVNLHITDLGRERVSHAKEVLDTQFGDAFDFVDPADEPAIRRFLTQVVQEFAPDASESCPEPAEPRQRQISRPTRRPPPGASALVTEQTGETHEQGARRGRVAPGAA